jgi:hypothetical protein
MAPLGSLANWLAGKVMKAPCCAGSLSGFEVTTGSRQEKSTVVTGRSPASVGLGTEVTGELAVPAADGGGVTADADGVVPAFDRDAPGPA